MRFFFASAIRDNNECTPLFDFVHNLHGGGNCAEIKDRNGWEQDQKYSTIETTIVKKIFAAHPRAAEQISSVAGGSPVSVLVAECCKAKSMNRLLKNDACRRLKILLDGLRDGRPLRTLCTSDNPVALQAFFALFDESGCLERLDAPILPKINLNKGIISGWTLLEILADFGTYPMANSLEMHPGLSSCIFCWLLVVYIPRNVVHSLDLIISLLRH